MREQAVKAYVDTTIAPERPELREQLYASALKALTIFAGGKNDKGETVAGLQAISDFMEQNVPEAERTKASEVLVRILNGVLYELMQIARAADGLAALPPDESTQKFMTQAVLSLSDVQLYPEPVVFELTNFEQVQASVFQVAKAPGKLVVYLGCLFLILGVFAMLYVRDRRVWVWLAPNPAGGADARMALSTNRKTMDVDREFDGLSEKLLGVTPSGGQ